jgi:hypothetical protein
VKSQPFKPGDLICYDWHTALARYPQPVAAPGAASPPMDAPLLILESRTIDRFGNAVARSYRVLFPTGEIRWTNLADSDYWEIIHRIKEPLDSVKSLVDYGRIENADKP